MDPYDSKLKDDFEKAIRDADEMAPIKMVKSVTRPVTLLPNTEKISKTGFDLTADSGFAKPKSSTPSKTLQTPSKKLETPSKKLETPKKIETHAKKKDTPVKKNETPTTKKPIESFNAPTPTRNNDVLPSRQRTPSNITPSPKKKSETTDTTITQKTPERTKMRTIIEKMKTSVEEQKQLDAERKLLSDEINKIKSEVCHSMMNSNSEKLAWTDKKRNIHLTKRNKVKKMSVAEILEIVIELGGTQKFEAIKEEMWNIHETKHTSKYDLKLKLVNNAGKRNSNEIDVATKKKRAKNTVTL